MKEMVLTMSCVATTSSSLLSAYLPPSGLTPRGVKIANPTPLKGRQLSLSSVAMDDESMLSTRRTPLGSTLHSYTLQSLVPSPQFSLPLRILHRAREPARHSLIGEKSIQAHYLEPGALPSCQGGHPGGQPISG